MSEKNFKGTVAFVNYEKHYATIEYKDGTRKKSVSFQFASPEAGKEKARKAHYFRVGDEVSFQVALTAKGDKFTAHDVRFLYNTALEVLLNQAAADGILLGYLKEADDKLYVKEISSYLFFPLELSPWEHWPDPKFFNEQVKFRLLHIDNMKKLAAELIHSEFIPEYKKLLYHFNRKEPLQAIVEKVSPYAIYLDLGNQKIHSKITLDDKDPAKSLPLPGDQVRVRITYLSKLKVVVEMAEEDRAPGP